MKLLNLVSFVSIFIIKKIFRQLKVGLVFAYAKKFLVIITG